MFADDAKEKASKLNKKAAVKPVDKVSDKVKAKKGKNTKEEKIIVENKPAKGKAVNAQYTESTQSSLDSSEDELQVIVPAQQKQLTYKSARRAKNLQSKPVDKDPVKKGKNVKGKADVEQEHGEVGEAVVTNSIVENKKKGKNIKEKETVVNEDIIVEAEAPKRGKRAARGRQNKISEDEIVNEPKSKLVEKQIDANKDEIENDTVVEKVTRGKTGKIVKKTATSVLEATVPIKSARSRSKVVAEAKKVELTETKTKAVLEKVVSPVKVHTKNEEEIKKSKAVDESAKNKSAKAAKIAPSKSTAVDKPIVVLKSDDDSKKHVADKPAKQSPDPKSAIPPIDEELHVGEEIIMEMPMIDRTAAKSISERKSKVSVDISIPENVNTVITDKKSLPIKTTSPQKVTIVKSPISIYFS